MENKIIIKLIKPKDSEELAEVYVRAFKKRREKWTKKRAKELIASYLKKQPDMVFMAQRGNKIVGGFLCLIKPWWNGNHVVETELFTDPKFQKLGIGNELFKTLLKKADKRYRATVFEGITFSNTKFPMSWYGRLGLKRVNGLMLIDGKIGPILKKISTNR